MSKWNSLIFLKTKSSWADNNVSKWDGVANIWSTSGDWDWCIRLDDSHSSHEKTEEFVAKLRDTDWVANTETNWWKEVAANPSHA